MNKTFRLFSILAILIVFIPGVSMDKNTAFSLTGGIALTPFD